MALFCFVFSHAGFLLLRFPTHRKHICSASTKTKNVFLVRQLPNHRPGQPRGSHGRGPGRGSRASVETGASARGVGTWTPRGARASRHRHRLSGCPQGGPPRVLPGPRAAALIADTGTAACDAGLSPCVRGNRGTEPQDAGRWPRTWGRQEGEGTLSDHCRGKLLGGII